MKNFKQLLSSTSPMERMSTKLTGEGKKAAFTLAEY